MAGLHRSPDFGFSQEFAEYRAYTSGDDLSHVDWNLFARTERTYLKRYRGETNSRLTVLLDASNWKNDSSHRVTKMDYVRYTAASLFYLTLQHQRDPAGLLVFDDEVRNYIRPSRRQGQLPRLLSGLEQAEPKARTDFEEPLRHLQQLLSRRGMVILISDFYEAPETIVKTVEPLRFHGSEVVLFHVLSLQEIHPQLHGPSVLVDLEFEHVSLLLHPTATATAPNWTVEGVKAPAQLVDLKKSRVLTRAGFYQVRCTTPSGSPTFPPSTSRTCSAAARDRPATRRDAARRFLQTARCAWGHGEANLANCVQRTEDGLRRGINPNANGNEAAIASGLKKLDEGLKQAQVGMGASPDWTGARGKQGKGTEVAALDQLERLRSPRRQRSSAGPGAHPEGGDRTAGATGTPWQSTIGGSAKVSNGQTCCTGDILEP